MVAMYDGSEYQANWNQRGSNTSIEGKKHPYLKKDFWIQPINHFWENENYTEEGKEICREFVKGIKQIYDYRK